MSDPPAEHDPVLRRLDQLERENARLRETLEPLLGPDNPNFKPHVFLAVLNRTIVLAMIPLMLGIGSMFFVNFMTPGLKSARVGGVPVFSFAGQGGKVRGVGTGIVAYGGLSVGVVAVGGVSVGLVAFGGLSLGVFAVGGGAVGLVAVGGGAVGLIAVGGTATGFFAMGQKAHGRHAIGLNRQDEHAVTFFRRYVPGLHRALTNPIPVILLDARPLEPTATDAATGHAPHPVAPSGERGPAGKS